MAKRKTGPEKDPTRAHVALEDLKPHPRNYKKHPADQVDHIASSLKEFGDWRPVVVARDNTILAGHGLTLAARKLGWKEVWVHRLDLDPNERRALKVLALDNEVGRFADGDDRTLTELLREVMNDDPVNLVGTGYDEKMLASLLMVTRPASEVKDADAAAEWVGMPDYETEPERIRLIVCFDSEAEKAELVEQLGVTIAKTTGKTSTAWYPPRERADLASLRFETEDGADDEPRPETS